MVTGSFSKPEITIPDFSEENISQEYICSKFSKVEILSRILDLLEALWVSNQQDENNNLKDNMVFL